MRLNSPTEAEILRKGTLMSLSPGRHTHGTVTVSYCSLVCNPGELCFVFLHFLSSLPSNDFDIEEVKKKKKKEHFSYQVLDSVDTQGSRLPLHVPQQPPFVDLDAL